MTALQAIEPALKNAPVPVPALATGGYSLVATATGPTGGSDSFTLADSSGTVTRTCSGNAGGCPNTSW
jgi:hypothetical protein